MRAPTLLVSLILLQVSPAYVREGDRVAQEFHAYQERLTGFFGDLRSTIGRELPTEQGAGLVRQLEKAPPPVGLYGYKLLPRIVDIPQPPTPIRSFSYSWPITEGYIRGEDSKLDSAKADLARAEVAAPAEQYTLLAGLAQRYREFVKDQGTVDQYIEYNRFWQRSIAESRDRYDRMTQVYQALKSGNPDTAATIREVLGKPQAPKFIRVRGIGSNRVTLQVRLYTDIDDDAYLAQARSVIEDTWHADDGRVQYAVELDLRKMATSDLYRGKDDAPSRGDHINLDKHVGRFPNDGGVLTTGAEFTYGSIGRYVALGPGDLSPKTLAHEFGHILGFNDGYIRGYTNLGEKGFEILELTAFFDDIMSAPREGHVQITHFRLLMEALN